MGRSGKRSCWKAVVLVAALGIAGAGCSSSDSADDLSECEQRYENVANAPMGPPDLPKEEWIANCEGVEAPTPVEAASGTLADSEFSDVRSAWEADAWSSCLSVGGYDTSDSAVEVVREAEAPTDQLGVGVTVTVRGSSDGPSFVSLDWLGSTDGFVFSLNTASDERFYNLLDQWGCPE